MHALPPRLRPGLLAFAAAVLLMGCDADSPDLPEAPPAQDGTIEEPDPDAVEQPEIDPDAG